MANLWRRACTEWCRENDIPIPSSVATQLAEMDRRYASGNKENLVDDIIAIFSLPTRGQQEEDLRETLKKYI